MNYGKITMITLKILIYKIGGNLFSIRQSVTHWPLLNLQKITNQNIFIQHLKFSKTSSLISWDPSPGFSGKKTV